MTDDTQDVAPAEAPVTDTTVTPDVALSASLVNQDTALVLADPEVASTVSAPSPADGYNPLHASPNSGPLNYFPTLESRGIPAGPAVADGNEIPGIIATLPVPEQSPLPKAVDSDSPQPGDSETKDEQPEPAKEDPQVDETVAVVPAEDAVRSDTGLPVVPSEADTAPVVPETTQPIEQPTGENSDSTPFSAPSAAVDENGQATPAE